MSQFLFQGIAHRKGEPQRGSPGAIGSSFSAFDSKGSGNVSKPLGAVTLGGFVNLEESPDRGDVEVPFDIFLALAVFVVFLIVLRGRKTRGNLSPFESSSSRHQRRLHQKLKGDDPNI